MLPPELVYKIIELAGCGYSGSLESFVGTAAFGRPPGEARLSAILAETHGIRRAMAIVCGESVVRASAVEQIF